MSRPRRIWVTHSGVTEAEIKEAVQCDLEGIQLRCKELSIERLTELAQAARAITRQAGKQLIINSAIGVAKGVGADGIHLPESMIHCCDEGDFLPVTVSVHSLEAAILAQACGASAVTFGPIFQTASKQVYGEPQSPQKLAQVVQAVSIPVYAIGGITPSLVDTCLEAGAWGVMMQNHFSSIVKRRCLCQ